MQKVTTAMREKGMDQQERMEKVNKTLGRERCQNIDNQHKSKNKIKILLYKIEDELKLYMIKFRISERL